MKLAKKECATPPDRIVQWRVSWADNPEGVIALGQTAWEAHVDACQRYGKVPQYASCEITCLDLEYGDFGYVPLGTVVRLLSGNSEGLSYKEYIGRGWTTVTIPDSVIHPRHAFVGFFGEPLVKKRWAKEMGLI